MSIKTKQAILIGFGLLLLAMVVAQLVSYSGFYHTMRSYLVSPGAGVRLLDPFILPITFGFMLLHTAGAVGILLLSPANALREMLIKVGVLAMIIWLILILSILIRGAPIGYAGFFGEKLRQPVNIMTLLQSVIFVIWGFVAYQISQEEESV